ncbi:MAG TPA: hypothetical protein VJ729_02145 [Nitrososphaeraceae archaeon]|nr:hypothetical protein [Nitrososphaeraceae archaeon]
MVKTLQVGLCALVMMLIISLACGALQYKLANAQEEQPVQLRSYNNQETNINFKFPSYLVTVDVPNGVILYPASEENAQKSLVIFASVLPSKYLQLSPSDIVQQELHAQAIKQYTSNSILWVIYTYGQGTIGQIGFGKYGDKTYQFGFGVEGTNASQYLGTVRTVLNSMSLGPISSSTIQRAKQLQEDITRDFHNTEMNIISNMRV